MESCQIWYHCKANQICKPMQVVSPFSEPGIKSYWIKHLTAKKKKKMGRWRQPHTSPVLPQIPQFQSRWFRASYCSPWSRTGMAIKPLLSSPFPLCSPIALRRQAVNFHRRSSLLPPRSLANSGIMTSVILHISKSKSLLSKVMGPLSPKLLKFQHFYQE